MNNESHTFLYAVCEVIEYVHPASGVCADCPTNSTSAGGTPSMCTCNAGTGRVNETDVTLPCLGELRIEQALLLMYILSLDDIMVLFLYIICT